MFLGEGKDGAHSKGQSNAHRRQGSLEETPKKPRVTNGYYMGAESVERGRDRRRHSRSEKNKRRTNSEKNQERRPTRNPGIKVGAIHRGTKSKQGEGGGKTLLLRGWVGGARKSKSGGGRSMTNNVIIEIDQFFGKFFHCKKLEKGRKKKEGTHDQSIRK